jgi:hypothetical protein
MPWSIEYLFRGRWKKIRRAYSPPMQTNRLKGNSKTKTISPGSFGVYSDERLEDCPQRIFRNTRTMVPNGEKCQRFRRASIDLQIYLDIHSWFGKAELRHGAGRKRAAVPGAQVSLTRANGAKLHMVMAGANGKFTFTKLPPGSYLVTVDGQRFRVLHLCRIRGHTAADL